MTHTRVSATVRWFGVVTVLTIASGVASSWRPRPSAPPTVVSVAKMLPAIFTTLSAQTTVPGCVAAADVGNQFLINVDEFLAVADSNVERSIIKNRSLNVVGQGTLAEKFFEQASLAFDDYKAIKMRLNAPGTTATKITIKGKVTCTSSLWGNVSRTYYTDTNPNPGDPFVTDPDLADPQAAEIEIQMPDEPFVLDVDFSVGPGDTLVNIAFEQPQLVLYDTGGGSFTVFPGSPKANGADKIE